MAKKSAIAKNERRRLRAERTQERRAELVAQLKNPETDDEERDAIYLRLRKMGRDASPVRYRLRCGITGRSRSNYRKFGICRNKFRDLALLGEIPGVRKSSW